ncbi:MAG: hypothetical protein SFU85_08525 [Candidatus Methylacidiphilales bacterium]|nr:hypothetical protein [Candidatus Methylacidiphilales bacterium]
MLFAIWGAGVFQDRVRAVEGIDQHLSGAPAAARDAAQSHRTFLEADSYYWLCYARQMLREGDWRIRQSTADNSPMGREVHWSQSVSWILAALAWVMMALGEANPVHALEKGAVIYQPLALLMGSCGIGWIVFRWLGLVPSILFLTSLVVPSNILQTFHPLRPDHHALQAIGIACAALFWARAGGGWICAASSRSARSASQPMVAFSPPGLREAQYWMGAAGLCCGLLFWINALSALPTWLALCAAFAVSQHTAITGRRKETDDSQVGPDLARWFGTSAALASLACYFMEYFPNHLVVPLEANHPLYALMAWASGEALRTLARFRESNERVLIWQSVIWLSLASLPLVLLAFGGESLWKIKEPVHVTWLRFTSELDSWAVAYSRNPWELAVKNFGPAVAALAVWLVAVWVKPVSHLGVRALLGPAFLTGGYLVASLVQVRWMSQFSMVSWLMVVLSVAIWWKPRISIRNGCGWAMLTLALFWIISEMVYVHEYNQRSLMGRGYSVILKKFTVEKHMALELAGHLKPDSARILCHFGLAPALRYYADFPVVASLYWENTEGMRFTAAVLSAAKDERAKALLEERGITHVAVWLQDRDIFTYDALANGWQAAAARRSRDDLFLGRLVEGKRPAFLIEEPWMVDMENRRYGLDGRSLHPALLIRAIRP